jgi:preprotein translocase subunit SecG
VSSFGVSAFVFFYFMTAIALIALVLMHSGRDTGMAGMGYVPASQGGTHIVERNLTRLTIAVGTIFFVNSIILYHILA